MGKRVTNKQNVAGRMRPKKVISPEASRRMFGRKTEKAEETIEVPRGGHVFLPGGQFIIDSEQSFPTKGDERRFNRMLQRHIRRGNRGDTRTFEQAELGRARRRNKRFENVTDDMRRKINKLPKPPPDPHTGRRRRKGKI